MKRKFRAITFALQQNKLEKLEKLEALSSARKVCDEQRNALVVIHAQQETLIKGIRETMIRNDVLNPDFLQWGFQYAEVLAEQRKVTEEKMQQADQEAQIAYDQLAKATISSKRLSRKKEQTLTLMAVGEAAQELKELESLILEHPSRERL